MVNTIPRKQHLAFNCVTDGIGVNGLADSHLAEGYDGNGNECAEMHLELDDFDEVNALV